MQPDVWLKEWIEVARNVTTSLAALGALGWFMRTRAYKRRTEFDLTLRVFPLGDLKARLAEIAVEIENTGPVRETIRQVIFYIEQPRSKPDPDHVTSGNELPEVTWEQLGSTSYVSMDNDQPLVIMPGVHQVITHSYVVPEYVSVIRVTVAFKFRARENHTLSDWKPRYPYKRTARRVFDLRDPNRGK